MKFTPDERMALAALYEGHPDDQLGAVTVGFAAGIAHERARCAKVCRDEPKKWPFWVSNAAAERLALMIEAPDNFRPQGSTEGEIA